ncbi:hypothetical protein BO94DRAFT_610974 [Aspergillus sclerotioniger CBS 115572]|uniref:Uncharacterized protein n=1 Tax=Aspergillus sclerotioniger CBS 115572 TaxID=1450535 RepID=A0A317V8F1_9EURO|nr:hypothetical protein BO94DRAFT_610974 [Aspergillus sclerotioniger CBS 115572]PWY69659.1 hypothetical protein BO94DRAFT_610974 [Aspergillus sclerotioniger CBS 115572]
MSFLYLVDDTFERLPFTPSLPTTAEDKGSDKGKGPEEALSMEEAVANLTATLDASTMTATGDNLDVFNYGLSSTTEAPDASVQNKDRTEDDISHAETTSVDYMTPHDGDIDPTPRNVALNTNAPVTAEPNTTPGADATSREMNEDQDEPDTAPLLEDQGITPSTLFKATKPCKQGQDSTENDQAPSTSTPDNGLNKVDTRPDEGHHAILDRIDRRLTDAIPTAPLIPMSAACFSQYLRASKTMADETSPEVAPYASTVENKVSPTLDDPGASGVETPSAPSYLYDETKHQRLRLTYPRGTRSRVRVKAATPVLDAESVEKPIHDVNEEGGGSFLRDSESTRRIEIHYPKDDQAWVEFEGYGSQVEIIWRE